MQSWVKKVVALGFLGTAIGTSATPVIVREGVNAFVVALDGTKAPLRVNSIVEPGTLIQTDAAGRAQLEIGNSLIRLGAGSSLALSKEGHITLDHGTFLVKDIPPTDDVSYSRGGKEVRISGTLGFVNLDGTAEKPLVLIGALAGNLTVQTASTKGRLNPAEVLVGSGEKFQKSHFDLSKMTKTSRLLNGFTTPLTGNETLVTAERDFAALQHRGFVRASSRDDVTVGAGPEGVLIVASDRQALGLKTTASGATASASGLAQTLGVIHRDGITLEEVLTVRNGTGAAGRISFGGPKGDNGNGLGPDHEPNNNPPPSNPNGDPHTSPPGSSGSAPGHGK